MTLRGEMEWEDGLQVVERRGCRSGAGSQHRQGGGSAGPRQSGAAMQPSPGCIQC